MDVLVLCTTCTDKMSNEEIADLVRKGLNDFSSIPDRGYNCCVLCGHKIKTKMPS